MTFDAEFNRDHVECLGDSPAFQGFFTLAKRRYRHRKFGGGWTAIFEREVLVKADGAAAILYDPVSDRIGLVEQFRAGAIDAESPWCLEVVAGLQEPNESPEDVILREIAEEAGVHNARIIPITSYYSTPGCCDEKIHLFCALVDLSTAGGVHGLADEHEDILFSVYPAEEVFTAMLNSRMNNAATLIGLLWLQLNRPQLRTGHT
jgi:ADP-ribose pyrophosphatase